MWDDVVARLGPSAIRPDGGLEGPFNAWLHAPAVGGRMSNLAARLLFDSSLPRNLTELAILTVAARYRAEFEWTAHVRMARREGISDEVISAIQRGVQPTLPDRAHEVVHAIAFGLATDGRISSDVCSASRELLGDRGTVELVCLCGLYTTVAFVLNAFDVPPPSGREPAWTTSA